MPTTKAMRRATTTEPEERPQIIGEAIAMLAQARTLLRSTGSKKAADAVARAMKSADGARRHSEGQALKALKTKA